MIRWIIFESQEILGQGDLCVFFICVLIVTLVGENLDPKMPTVVTISTVPPDIFSLCLPG